MTITVYVMLPSYYYIVKAGWDCMSPCIWLCVKNLLDKKQGVAEHPLIPAFRRLKQKDCCALKVCLRYTVKLCICICICVYMCMYMCMYMYIQAYMTGDLSLVLSTYVRCLTTPYNSSFTQHLVFKKSPKELEEAGKAEPHPFQSFSCN